MLDKNTVISARLQLKFIDDRDNFSSSPASARPTLHAAVVSVICPLRLHFSALTYGERK